MTAFVDPRLHPEPPASVSREPASHGEALKELVQLCRAGRVYDVERWIQEGRPLQAFTYKSPKKPAIETPLHAAVRTNRWDLMVLLLCNGYRLDLEPRGWDSVLNQALENRAFDLVDLLLKWGADPHTVELSILFDTYKSELFARFQNLGVDLTKGHELAQALADHTSNRPLFGFAKRHRERNSKMQAELNIALGHHVSEGNEKGVLLCLWAGADPHAPALSLGFLHHLAHEDDSGEESDIGVSAMYEACLRGDVEILKRLGPDPTRDDFDELYQSARYAAVVDLLAKKAPPRDAAAVIRHQVWWAAYSHERWGSTDALQRLFEIGVRWTQGSADDIASMRAFLLRSSDSVFIELMKLLATADYCSPELLKAVARAPSMRARMKKVGFFPPEDDTRGFQLNRPTRSREVLKKFGVELPKPPPPPLPASIWVGSRSPDRREIKMGRAQLFERVWSEPVANLAAEWGLSGPGLKKVCRRLKIPVPPRGYWAKLKAGHRLKRVQLPTLEAASDPEIIFRIP